MKKLLAIVLTLIMVMSFTACNVGVKGDASSGTPSEMQGQTDETENKDDSNSEEVNDEVSNTPAENENSKPKENSKNESTESKNDKENYFLNDNNNFYDQNAVSVRPRYVYWENGKLIAECFVVNGFPHPVFNISVNSFTLSNSNGIIASGSFGNLQNLSLAPYTHALWKFEFSADCIEAYGADLTSLLYESQVSNNY